MAAGDLALNILVRADASAAVGAVGTLGGSLLHLGETGFKSISNGLGNLQFGFRNLGTAGTIGTDALKLGAMGVLKPLLQLGVTLGAIGGIAAIGIGVVAVHAAADFQQGLNRLRTGAGDTQDSFASLSKGILQVSTDTGVTAGKLNQAMYLILSSGQRGAQAMNTLEVASKGAVIEQANVVDVANVVSGAMHNFGTKTFSASQYMNGLIKAVSLGKISLQDLSTSMGPLEPLAHQLGISYADLSSAMTTQTNAMIPAARAATSLRFMMQSLEVPTHKANAAMTKWGLDSVKVAEEMKKSLPGALQMIYDAAKKAGPEGSVPFNRAVSDMIGGQRSLSAFLALTGTHMKDFKGNAAAIAEAMKSGKGEVAGWSIVQGNFNVQMDRAKAAGQALLITIGQQLLPVLTQMFAAIVPIIIGFTQWLVSSGALHNILMVLGGAFSVLGTVVSSVINFFKNNEVAMDALKAALILVAIVVGTVLVVAFIAAAWAVGAFTIMLLTNPITWIIIAIIAVITGIILVITHWGQITQWIGGIFSWLGAHVHAIFSAIGAFIGNVFSAIGTKAHEIVSNIGNFFSSLGTRVHTYLTAIQVLVGSIFSVMGTKVHDALMGIATFFINKWNDLVSFVKSIPSKISQALGNLKDMLLAPFKWFYDHNWYVKAAVDAIKQDITNLKNMVGGAFDWLGTHIHDALTGIKNGVGGAFDWIGTHAHDFATGVKNTIGGAFDWLGTHIHDRMTATKNQTGSLFDQIGSHARSFATGTKNTVGGAFDWIGTHVHQAMDYLGNLIGSKMSAIGTLIHDKLTEVKNFFGNIFFLIGVDVHNKITSMWNWLVGFANGWPRQALQWGINLIAGLINGIWQKFQDLKNMLGNVAGAIGNFLGFHSPTKEGPGREADRWAPNFIRMYVGGLHAGIPQVQSAFAALTAPAMARGSSNAFALQGGSSASAGGGYGVMNLQIKLDNRVLAEAVGVHLAKEIRINGRRNA